MVFRVVWDRAQMGRKQGLELSWPGGTWRWNSAKAFKLGLYAIGQSIWGILNVQHHVIVTGKQL
jgi:hypothetical protein